MKHRTLTFITLGVIGTLAAACGGSSPSSPTGPAPTPSTTLAPAPVPTPTPTPSPTGEPPVTRTTPPVRLVLRFYAVEDGSGNLIPGLTEDDNINVGWRVRVDVVAKDARNRETNGSGNVEWHLSDPEMAELRIVNRFQPRLIGRYAGDLEVYATLDGRTSNTVTIHWRFL